jgi:phosphate/sulfate permease
LCASATLQSPVPEWILVIGGVGIVFGLALFSSNISRCLGVQVAKITYARGFCAEFATAIVVAIASRYGETADIDPTAVVELHPSYHS